MTRLWPRDHSCYLGIGDPGLFLYQGEDVIPECHIYSPNSDLTAAIASPPSRVVTPSSQPSRTPGLAVNHVVAASAGSVPSFRIAPMISFSMASVNSRFCSSLPTLGQLST